MYDVNTLIGIIILVGIILLCYTHIEHLTNEVTYVKSTIDGEEYLVRNAPRKEEAANILARIQKNLSDLSNHMNQKYVLNNQFESESDNDEKPETSIKSAVERLVKKFNPKNISESGASNK